MKRDCAHCGKAFKAYSTVTKYCGESCRQATVRIRQGIRPISELLDKTCRQCGKAFKAKLDTKKFCCDACKKKYHAPKPKPIPDFVDCKACGASIPQTGTGKGGVKNYCSPTCYKRYRRSLIPKKPKPITSCEVCGASVQQPWAKGNRKKYCSHKCACKAARIRQGMPIIPPRPCPICGVEFQPRNVNGTACSRRCASKYYNDRRRDQGVCLRCNTQMPEDYDRAVCVECLQLQRAKDDEWEGRTPEERAELDAIRAKDEARIAREKKKTRAFVRYLLNSPKHPIPPLPPPLTPRELLARGVGWRRQRLQWLGRLT